MLCSLLSRSLGRHWVTNRHCTRIGNIAAHAPLEESGYHPLFKIIAKCSVNPRKMLDRMCDFWELCLCVYQRRALGTQGPVEKSSSSLATPGSSSSADRQEKEDSSFGWVSTIHLHSWVTVCVRNRNGIVKCYFVSGSNQTNETVCLPG